MFDIQIYEDEHGFSSFKTYLKELNEKSEKSKDARIKRNKIIAYVDLLEEMGTRVGEPITKHLEGDIWELRPLSDRILYAYINNRIYLLLHSFTKQTRKTPKHEIEKAKRELADYKRRQSDNE